MPITLKCSQCEKTLRAPDTAAGKKITLGSEQLELAPDAIGGWIRHHGWTLQVDPSAQLIWPIYPFNPYRNGPETDLHHAVAALSIPIAVKEPRAATLSWGTQKIKFVLDAKPEGTR